MSFDRLIEGAPRTVDRQERSSCETCGGEIVQRAVREIVEYAHVNPFDSHDSTLCDVDYPHSRARPVEKKRAVR